VIATADPERDPMKDNDLFPKGRGRPVLAHTRTISGLSSNLKTEASQKAVPLDSRLAAALKMWRDHTKYSQAGDWVFASPAARGQRPYWGQCLMRTIIRPAAGKVGITQHIGWHTFRHTYSSLLRANKTDIKVTQELLRHASSRVTLDTYTRQSQHTND